MFRTPGTFAIAAVFFLSPVIAPALHATEPTLLDQGYRDMYNLNFDNAHRSFRDWERKYPGDPMGPASDAAAYLFSEFDRMHILQSEFFVQNSSFLHLRKMAPDARVKARFEEALHRSELLANAILQRSPGDRTALFATVLRLGLHADYLALIEKRYVGSLSEVKQSREVAEQLVSKHPECYDAYLAPGVENYLLSLKAAPVRWILRMNGAQTDKDAGVAKLRLTAEKGRYLKPYARLLLAVAALRDKDLAGARQILTWLTQQFPQNHLYREELAKIQ
ncbi:MAG: hypothetical protein ACR2NN_24045 [Bryobacteraceae bacterium]